MVVDRVTRASLPSGSTPRWRELQAPELDPRTKKHIGDKLAETVVKAMHKHAVATAFCISTDASGVSVQPIYSHEKGRVPCQNLFRVCGSWLQHAVPNSEDPSAPEQ